MNNDFNLENWPLVYLKIDDNKLNEEYFDEYKKNYLNLLIKCKRNNEKMILICDLNELNLRNNFYMKFIMKQVQFTNDIYKFNKLYLTCVCILCRNKTLKNILNVFFSIIKQASPYKLCMNSEKANIYLKEKYNIDFDVNIYLKNSENIEYMEEDNEINEEYIDENIKNNECDLKDDIDDIENFNL
jgi:hypothetical protein